MKEKLGFSEYFNMLISMKTKNFLTIWTTVDSQEENRSV